LNFEFRFLIEGEFIPWIGADRRGLPRIPKAFGTGSRGREVCCRGRSQRERCYLGEDGDPSRGFYP